jgi:toxin FitB
MKYVVDANVLSEPTKPVPDPRGVAWLRENEPDVAVDPVILANCGIVSISRIDPFTA